MALIWVTTPVGVSVGGIRRRNRDRRLERIKHDVQYIYNWLLVEPSQVDIVQKVLNIV